MILPMQEMAKHGYEVTFRGGNLDSNQGFRAADMAGHDLIVGQRLNAPAGIHVWREARTASSRLVYELDDDVFNIGPENWAAHQLWADDDVRWAAQHAIQVADMVTTTTPFLAGVLREYNPNVAVIPNHVPGWVCDHRRVRTERPRIGWMGGASHGLDVGEIVSPVRRFLKRFPGWDLHLAGTDYRPTFRVGDRATYGDWVRIVEDTRGFYDSIRFDIGLAPLVCNTFSAAKSAIKAIEYGALGIPVIATDWHPYRDYIRHGETGFLVKRDHEWLGYMSELASDENLREEMGNKARELAREYTIERGWKLWADAYGSLFKESR
jgi:glycosyltransferase involved in cell wall biosynthesis